jgi:peroxiredoxin-like protein
MAASEGAVEVSSEGLVSLSTLSPKQFGGPGDQWSPETMLVAAVADCYVLTFRAIARASHLEWHTLTCAAEGVLDRVDNVTRFTRFNLEARLNVPAGTDEQKARRLLQKAEAVCLISSSLNAEKHLEIHLDYAA